MKEFFSNLETIKKIFKENDVVLAYIFGSAAKKELTKLSDIDGYIHSDNITTVYTTRNIT